MRDELVLGPTFRTEVVTEVVMPEENRIVATRRGYNEHIGPERILPSSKIENPIKSLFLTESY